MKAFPFCILLLLAGGGWHPARAQTELEETIFADTEHTVSAAVLDDLEEYRRRPVNLNSCTLPTMRGLPFLTPVSALAIYRERRSRGPFISWDDFEQRLSSVLDGIDRLRDVVCFRTSIARPALHWRARVTAAAKRPPPSSSAPERGYALQQRCTLSAGERLSAAFLIEKDSGEPSWADHAAGFAAWTAVSNHVTILLGDYCLETGQGLSCWGPYAAPKGAEPGAHVLKQPRGIRGYASGDENRFMRGAAASALVGPFSIAGFVSRRDLDAVISGEGLVTSTPLSGLHVSASEQRNKDRLAETVCGGVLEYRFAAGCLGVTASNTTYSAAFGPGSREDGYYAFRGKINRVGGCYGMLDLPGCTTAGEIAISSAGGGAAVLTVMIRSALLPLVISAYRFDPDFHNPRSHCAGISPAVNRSGAYLALSRTLPGGGAIAWYCDLGATLWRTFTLPVTNRWNEQCVVCRKKVTRSLLFTGRIRRKQGLSAAEATAAYEPAKQTGERVQTQYRLAVEWRYRRHARLQARFDFTRVRYRFFAAGEYGPPPARGKLLSLAWYCTGASLLRVTSRFSLFDTEGWDARVYLFENSVPGTMSISPLSGRGAAWTVSLACHLSRRFRICAALSLQASGPDYGHPVKTRAVFQCQTELSL